MAAGQKLYPRATVKKIVKAHSNRNITKNVDVLVGLDASESGTAVDAIRYFSTMLSSFKRMRYGLQTCNPDWLAFTTSNKANWYTD
jgi:hypothetical protein